MTEAAPADGRWTLTFSPHAYTREPQRMVIRDESGHEAVLEDILIGDVWLIGGQSNAELTLAPCMTMTPSVGVLPRRTTSGCSRRRRRLLPPTRCTREQPQLDIINPAWCWKRPGREASLEFSAMGWYFARELTKQIDVPLGLVLMCAGGACIRELIPEELARAGLPVRCQCPRGWLL